MKKTLLIFVITFVSFLASTSAFAYDTCVAYHPYNNPNPTLPCSYNGYDYDSLAVEAGVNSFFYKGEKYVLTDYDWWWSLTSPEYVTQDGILYAWGSWHPQYYTLSFSKSGALFFGVGASYSKTLTVYINPAGSGSITVNEDECQTGPCQFSVLYESEAEATATPATGYAFAYWLEGETHYTDNPHTFTNVTEDMEVTAVFYLKADDFVFPVLAQGVTDPLQNTTDPAENGWHGPGVGELSAYVGHLGQDYVMDSGNGDGNAAGEPVYAVANGIIVEVMNNQNTSYGWCDNDDHGWGPVVVIRHENRDGFNTIGSIVTTSCDTEINPTVIYSLYGHLSKTSIQNLRIGQIVHMGDQLGVLSDHSAIPSEQPWSINHLHFELKDEAGFNEKSWYYNQANWGECPGTAAQSCDAEGIGTAYSHATGFAPHRYNPGAFILNNEQ